MRRELKCEECGEAFFRKRISGRTPKYCSRRCYSIAYERHPDDTRDTPKDAICGLCKNPFVKKKRNQRYCSRGCYEKAWPVLNREKHNAHQRKKRQQNPAWFQKHEPKYYKTYRAKSESSRPWKYLLQSAKNRAEEKGLLFDLTDEWACARWNGCCELTGLVFRTNGKRGPHPFSASVDRKDPALGYIQENTRFILWGCNAIKGVGTDQDMFEIARAIVNTGRIS